MIYFCVYNNDNSASLWLVHGMDRSKSPPGSCIGMALLSNMLATVHSINV